MGNTAQQGDTVEIRYMGKLDDGTVFGDNSQDETPFSFKLGDPHVIQGVQDALIGMEEGSKKIFQVAPGEGYGEYDETLQVRLSLQHLPEEIEVGNVVQDQESQINMTVTEISDGEALLDGNHFLAGKNLTFEVELLKIKPST